MDESRPPEQPGVSDALRDAIERTLSSVGDTRLTSAADLPAETVGRAGELLDEVARRGHDVGAEIARLGKGAAGRLIDAVADTLKRDPKPKPEGE
ncbi:MAG: hypothetical protein ACRDL3_03550 [Solirubrobacterales bacterium]